MPPRFKECKMTRQMVCLTYFCNAPIRNGGLKVYGLQCRIKAVISMFFVIKNYVVVNFVSETRALKRCYLKTFVSKKNLVLNAATYFFLLV